MDLEERIQSISELQISNREKVDLLLKLDAELMMSIDKNSTKKDKDKRKVQSRKIYRAIKPFDVETYEILIKNA